MGIPYFIVANAGGGFIDLNPDDPRPVWYQYGATRQLGYLKVAVDPENNTATAQEIFVAYVETNDSENATVYDPPIIADTVTFPLSRKHPSPAVPALNTVGVLALCGLLLAAAIILMRRRPMRQC